MRSMRKTGFVRRFMVLTNTRLYYLTSEPSTSFRDEIHFEVNLEIINEILNRDYHDKGLGKFDIVTPSRHLTIKCPFDEKLLWIRDIQVRRKQSHLNEISAHYCTLLSCMISCFCCSGTDALVFLCAHISLHFFCSCVLCSADGTRCYSPH
mgnify:CR=1 FL=1